jgi:hypothetical protein
VGAPVAACEGGQHSQSDQRQARKRPANMHIPIILSGRA